MGDMTGVWYLNAGAGNQENVCCNGLEGKHEYTFSVIKTQILPTEWLYAYIYMSYTYWCLCQLRKSRNETSVALCHQFNFVFQSFSNSKVQGSLRDSCLSD